VPIALELPLGLGVIVDQLVVPLPPNLMATFTGLYGLHATTDALILLLVIKPFRRAIAEWSRKRFCKSVAPTEQPPMVLVAKSQMGGMSGVKSVKVATVHK